MSELRVLIAGDGRGSRTVVMGPRKASVTFQWMKSRPTMDQEVFLFSTFDQVVEITYFLELLYEFCGL